MRGRRPRRDSVGTRYCNLYREKRGESASSVWQETQLFTDFNWYFRDFTQMHSRVETPSRTLAHHHVRLEPGKSRVVVKKSFKQCLEQLF